LDPFLVFSASLSAIESTNNPFLSVFIRVDLWLFLYWFGF